MSVIQRAAIGGSWQAAAWWLERTQPGLYGRRQKFEHTGAEGQPIKLEVSTQEIEEKIQLVLKARNSHI